MELSSSVSHWLSEDRDRTLEEQLTETDLPLHTPDHTGSPVTMPMERQES